MSNTLILRSTKTLSSPLPGTPKIPDLVSGLYWELNPATLSALADGASIDSWIASGVAPLVNRTYDAQFSGWSKPTYSSAGGPGGAPAVLFNGSQQICNQATGAFAKTQPLTYAIVCKSSAFENLQARTFSDTNNWIFPIITGYSTQNTGASGPASSGNKTTDWVSIIAVFDGANSKLKVGSGPMIAATLGTLASARNIFGGNPAPLSTAGLKGGIAFARAYSRALTDNDISALTNVLKARFSLTT